MVISLTREQLDLVLPLEYTCDSCGPASQKFRQGDCEGQLFHVAIAPGLHHDVFGNLQIGETLEADLCRAHVARFRSFITWGVTFCQCGGINEPTGRTRPIEKDEGVWIETKCEFSNRPGIRHYHDWEALD